MATDTLVPFEVRPGDIQVKRSAASLEGGMGVVQQAKDPMEFWIIGGVTGIVDEVNDIVEPGAYVETLKKRKPKIIKDHDWTHRLGKVLDIFEAMPGDPRLPKTTARGEAWPAEAGALMAKVRLFDTEEGRNAATRWAEEGVEQEFSIGYIARKARKDPRTSIRHIKTLDCFEISDVLWGAMPLAGPLPEGLATKIIAGLALEAKNIAAVEDDEQVDPDEVEVDLGLFDELPETEGGTASIAPAEATDEDEDEFDDRPEIAQVAEDTDDEDDEEPEGIEVKYDTSPVGSPGDKENWVDKVGGLPKFIRAIAHALIREGKTEQAAIRIAVGTVKRWASGGGEVSAKTRAKAAKAVAEWEAKRAKAKATKSAADIVAGLDGGGLRMERDVRIKAYNPQAEEGPDAGITPVDEAEAPAGTEPVDRTQVEHNGALMPQDEVIESKMFGGCLPGSYEERQRMVQAAAWEALRGPEREGYDGSGQRYEWSEVAVVSMWDDRAVVARYNWTSGNTDTEHFEVPYEIRGEEALLGTPEEVRLVVTTVVESSTGTEEDIALPFADSVDAVTVGVKTMLAGLEVKAGRVLSGANEARLRSAVENLLGVLKVAGVDITPPADDAGADTGGTEPAGAPTGQEPVEAKDLRGSGEVIPAEDLPDPAAYAASLRTFADAHS